MRPGRAAVPRAPLPAVPRRGAARLEAVASRGVARLVAALGVAAGAAVRGGVVPPVVARTARAAADRHPATDRREVVRGVERAEQGPETRRPAGTAERLRPGTI